MGEEDEEEAGERREGVERKYGIMADRAEESGTGFESN